MEGVKRYDLVTDNHGLCDMCSSDVEECSDGDYVLYSDYEKLENEKSILIDSLMPVIDFADLVAQPLPNHQQTALVFQALKKLRKLINQ